MYHKKSDWNMKRKEEARMPFFIYRLEGLGDYQGKLLLLLKNAEITTIHGDAIKRITKHPLYWQLNLKQKIEAIEEARKTVKFTDNEAGFINLEQIMKQLPKKII